jgi:hypothetical protein
MTYVPHGYVSVHEAVDHLGHELFPSDWTGKERNARPGLIGTDEWLRTKDLAPARGSDAPAGVPHRKAAVEANPRDPSSASYQMEYQAGHRCDAARDRLRGLLERGDLEAAVLDPITGKIHPIATTVWRRSGADRMIRKGRASIPRSSNIGPLIVKEFRTADAPAKPMPAAKIREAIKALQEEMAQRSLTRLQQAHFVRKQFPGYRVTERLLREIYQSVKVPPGRPKQKSDTPGA